MVRLVLAVCLFTACLSPLAPVAYAADAGQEGAKQPEEKGLTRAQYMSQVVEQLAFVSSILAGFAFSVIVQLVVSTQKGKAVAWALGTFMVSASSLLFATYLCSILRFAIPLTEARGGDETLTKLTPVAVLVWLSFGLGLLAFSAGIGIAGWVYSKAVGCVGVLCAVALFFLLVLCTYYIGTVFMEYKKSNPPQAPSGRTAVIDAGYHGVCCTSAQVPVRLGSHGYAFTAPRVTAVQMRTRRGNVEPDLPATRPGVPAECGV
jgi:hypothetical protein